MKISVIFINENLSNEFNSLKEGRFEDKQLYKFISKAIENLKTNPSRGIKIPRKLWPKEYLKYKITNLWKYNLPNAWRLIYTIEANDVMIMSIILEWFDHKGYEKRFGYR